MRFSHTVETTAPPPRIWAAWIDVAAWPSWDTELLTATLHGPFADGATGRLRAKGSPPATFTVSALESGRSYTFTTRLPLAALQVTRILTPLSEGTRFTHEVAFTGTLGPLFGALLGRRYRATLPEAMEQLRRIAEAAR